MRWWIWYHRFMFFNFSHLLAWFLTNLKHSARAATHQGSQNSLHFGQSVNTPVANTCEKVGTLESAAFCFIKAPGRWSGVRLISKRGTWKSGPVPYEQNSTAPISKIFGYLLQQNTVICDICRTTQPKMLTFSMVFLPLSNNNDFLHCFARTHRTKHSLKHLVLTPFLQLELKNRDPSCLELKARTCSQSMTIHIISHILWKYLRDGGVVVI